MSKNMNGISEKGSRSVAMYKCELARCAGVSRETFRQWCRASEEELSAYGYKRHSHILSPGAVEWLCKRYGIRTDGEWLR